jgi:CBS-domain-containing membrane protein
MQSKTLPHSDVVYLIGSFGASCVLIWRDSKPSSPTPKLSWRPCHFGNRRVTVAFVPDIMWLTASLSVSISIVLMQLTKTLHPLELLP